MAKLRDLSGQRFNRWYVINRAENRISSHSCTVMWNCMCDCGTKKEVNGHYLISGISKSCGCYMKEKATLDSTTHGLSKTKEYKKWMNMHNRCYNEKSFRYKDWGGRGIKVCPRWDKTNPEGFINYCNDLKALGSRPYIGATLDRINNDGDYAPDNVQWSSKREQRVNQRGYRMKYFTHNGKTLCMKDWGQELNTHPSNIIYWLKKGQDFEWIHAHYTEVNKFQKVAGKKRRFGKGTRWNKINKKWWACITVGGKRTHLGYFDSEEKASEAYGRACARVYVLNPPHPSNGDINVGSSI